MDLEAGLVSFTLYRVRVVSVPLPPFTEATALYQSSNSLEAFSQAKSVIEGLVNGTVSHVVV